MSARAINHVFRTNWGSHQRKLLAVHLAHRANDDGAGTIESARLLAEQVELPETTTRAMLVEMVDLGVLTVRRRAGAPGFRYRLELDQLKAMRENLSS